jgi:hypothetical protein
VGDPVKARCLMWKPEAKPRFDEASHFVIGIEIADAGGRTGDTSGKVAGRRAGRAPRKIRVLALAAANCECRGGAAP